MLSCWHAHAEKSAPSRALLRDNVQFLYTDVCRRAVEKLRVELGMSACLRMPDPGGLCVPTTDSSTVLQACSQCCPEPDVAGKSVRPRFRRGRVCDHMVQSCPDSS